MAVRLLMLAAVLLGDSPVPYEYGLATFLKLIGVAVLSLLVCAAVLLTAYLIAWLLAERPQAGLAWGYSFS